MWKNIAAKEGYGIHFVNKTFIQQLCYYTDAK